jgi:hypothetical protein
MMWRCSWQDYRGWRTADLKQPRPEVQVKDFATREEADREARIQQSAGMTTCVSPAPEPRSVRRRSRFPDPALPAVPKDARRLTP